MTALKGCPFCGSNNVLCGVETVDCQHICVIAGCKDCGVMFREDRRVHVLQECAKMADEMMDELTMKWNRRAIE